MSFVFEKIVEITRALSDSRSYIYDRPLTEINVIASFCALNLRIKFYRFEAAAFTNKRNWSQFLFLCFYNFVTDACFCCNTFGFSVLSQGLTGKNVSEITYFVLGWTYNLHSVRQWVVLDTPLEVSVMEIKTIGRYIYLSRARFGPSACPSARPSVCPVRLHVPARLVSDAPWPSRQSYYGNPSFGF